MINVSSLSKTITKKGMLIMDANDNTVSHNNLKKFVSSCALYDVVVECRPDLHHQPTYMDGTNRIIIYLAAKTF